MESKGQWEVFNERLERLWPNPLVPAHWNETTAKTTADIHRHLYARVALLNCLGRDHRVRQRWEDWADETGLRAAAHELAQALQAFAKALGVPHRGALWSLLSCPGADDILRRNYGLFAEVSLASASWKLAYGSYVRRRPDVRLFAYEELRLPYSWLPMDLWYRLFHHLYGYALGISVPFGYSYEPHDPPAPADGFTFTPLPEESVRVTAERFETEARAYRAKLVEMANTDLPIGKLRRDLEPITRRNVQWFYQHRLYGTSYRELSKLYHQQKTHTRSLDACGCWREVKQGIKNAENILALIPDRH